MTKIAYFGDQNNLFWYAVCMFVQISILRRWLRTLVLVAVKGEMQASQATFYLTSSMCDGITKWLFGQNHTFF